MLRVLLIAVVATAAATGCKQLNAEYCATHTDDTDCQRMAVEGAVDAAPGCMANAMCKDPTKAVCEVATGQCVQCVPGGDVTACTGTDVCGEDRLCHGCIVDTQCAQSKVCLPTGECAMEGDILYASPEGTGNCSQATPCTFTQAITMLSTTKTIIKMTTTAGTDYADPPVTIAKPALVIGTGTTLTPTGAGAAITVKADVEIDGITINAATTDGVFCDMPGKLTLRRATVTGSGGYGVHTTKCDALVERNRLMRNKLGGLFLAAGTFEVRNNFVGPGNGDDNLAAGSMHFDMAKGRAVFNTVAGNFSQNGGGMRVSGMLCGGSKMFRATRNIFAANGDANNALGGDCDYGTLANFISSSLTTEGFAMGDFHLTAASPAAILRDDPEAEQDCHVNGATGPYIDDIDGQPRPNGQCDRGADEFVP